MDVILGLLVVFGFFWLVITIIRSILVWIGAALGEGAQKARDEANRKRSDNDG
ncbi:hypothetical protein [Thioalkalivibrio sp. HK1]|uniref:hypothetical protein n=1 Tax=Thioalkalivibrio sp. HK1 TaxID=1469245 RepID=UPI0012DFE31C|nr:hypothetical protein [Thioalkalivibrio sp. HK1]